MEVKLVKLRKKEKKMYRHQISVKIIENIGNMRKIIKKKMISQKKNEECENRKFNSPGRVYLKRCFLNT